MTAIDPSRLSLDRLKTLVVFAETGRVEETARKLHMTQAGVSLQLKKLEEELGEPLFRIVGRQKHLTALGKELYESLAPSFQQLEKNLSHSHRESLSSLSQSLRIGCRAEMWSRLNQDLEFPGRLIFKNLSREQSIKALAEDRIDLAVMTDPPSSHQWLAKKWIKSGVIWCASRKIFSSAIPKSWEDVLAKKSQWIGENFAAYKENPPYLTELNLDSSSIKNKWVLEDWRSLAQILSEEKGWSLIPQDICGANDNLIQIPVQSMKPQQFYIVYGEHLKRQKKFRELIKISDR